MDHFPTHQARTCRFGRQKLQLLHIRTMTLDKTCMRVCFRFAGSASISARRQNGIHLRCQRACQSRSSRNSASDGGNRTPRRRTNSCVQPAWRGTTGVRARRCLSCETNVSYEELTFIPTLLGQYRPGDYDVTLSCSYPFTNWVLRRPTWQGISAPSCVRHSERRLAGLFGPFPYRFFGCEGFVCAKSRLL